MKPNQLFANVGNYTRGRTKSIKYIVVHYTANNGDTAKGNCNYFSAGGRGASAHYFVDENEIYQSVMDGDTAWHCESRGMALKCGCRNSNSIGIEMCSDKVNGVYVITADTVTNTVGLVKLLMQKYNVPVENVLRHYDVCGKNCPEPFVRDAAQWVAFKKKQEDEEMEKVYNTMSELPQWAQATIQKLIDKKYLSGDNGKLGLTETAVKVFVVNDRAGLY